MCPLFPFRAFVRTLQELNGVNSKCNFPLPHVFPQPPFPLKREPTASAPRGATLGTRINKYRPLVMSLRFVRQLRNNTAQSLVLFRQARRSLSRRRCGSCSVFEIAHSVYKNASNMYPFGCGCPTHNCNEVAISLAQSANITVAIGNNITHALRAYHLPCHNRAAV